MNAQLDLFTSAPAPAVARRGRRSAAAPSPASRLESLCEVNELEGHTAELTAQVNALAALVEPLTLNRDGSAR